MYKKGGFNPRPDTSYQSPASKAARKKVAKDEREKDMADTEFIRSVLRKARHATLDGSKGEKFDVPKSSKEMQDALKKRLKSKEYNPKYKPPKSFKGGGKMPEYMYGGKVYKDGGSLMEALLKNPEQRAKAKKMLGM